MSFEYYEALVLQWAAAKGILEHGDPKTQCLKFISEAGELADAIAKNNAHEIEDAIGDVLVTLINLAFLTNQVPTQCLATAYNVIKDRKGKMINGTFVKEK